MDANPGMLLWLWLLIVPVIALFLIAPGGTTSWRPRELNESDRRSPAGATMVEGVPDDQLHSKLEVRPEMASTQRGARMAESAEKRSA